MPEAEDSDRLAAAADGNGQRTTASAPARFLLQFGQLLGRNAALLDQRFHHAHQGLRIHRIHSVDRSDRPTGEACGHDASLAAGGVHQLGQQIVEHLGLGLRIQLKIDVILFHRKAFADDRRPAL